MNFITGIPRGQRSQNIRYWSTSTMPERLKIQSISHWTPHLKALKWTSKLMSGTLLMMWIF